MSISSRTLKTRCLSPFPPFYNYLYILDTKIQLKRRNYHELIVTHTNPQSSGRLTLPSARLTFRQHFVIKTESRRGITFPRIQQICISLSARLLQKTKRPNKPQRVSSASRYTKKKHAHTIRLPRTEELYLLCVYQTRGDYLSLRIFVWVCVCVFMCVCDRRKQHTHTHRTYVSPSEAAAAAANRTQKACKLRTPRCSLPLHVFRKSSPLWPTRRHHTTQPPRHRRPLLGFSFTCDRLSHT